MFAHISAVRGDRRPVVGDQVLFIASRDERGRWRAEHFRLAGELSLDQPQIRVKPRAAVPARKGRAAAPRHGRSARQPAATLRNPLAKLALFALLCSLPLSGSLRWLADQQVLWPLLIYCLASLLCFALYWHDKSSARNGARRIPENTLHLIELAGGWPGALVAQQALRHKTRKGSYQLLFWCIVALHQLFWADQLLLAGTYTGGLLRGLL